MLTSCSLPVFVGCDQWRLSCSRSSFQMIQGCSLLFCYLLWNAKMCILVFLPSCSFALCDIVSEVLTISWSEGSFLSCELASFFLFVAPNISPICFFVFFLCPFAAVSLAPLFFCSEPPFVQSPYSFLFFVWWGSCSSASAPSGCQKRRELGMQEIKCSATSFSYCKFFCFHVFFTIFFKYVFLFTFFFSRFLFSFFFFVFF